MIQIYKGSPLMQFSKAYQEPLDDTVVWLERKKWVDSAVYSDLLRKCGSSRSLTLGIRVDAHIIQCGRDRETYIGNYLIEMYGKCGKVDEARRVFEAILDRNVFSWNLMIAAYARHGHSRDAWEVFRRIDLEGVKPSRVTFLGVLDSCSGARGLAAGLEIHARMVEGGFESDVVACTALLNMYGRCSGDARAARAVFDGMEVRDLVSWNAIVVVYSQKAQCEEAVKLYRQMLLQGVQPDEFVFSSVIFACSDPKLAAEGSSVHRNVMESGLESHVVVGNALLHMYGKHGNFGAARRVFDRIENRDVISWTAMIVAYSHSGQGRAALEVLEIMRAQRVKLDRVGYTSVIDTCTSLGALEEGRRIHSQIAKQGLETDVAVGSALVNMYGKCGDLEDARAVFAGIEGKDRCAWTSMLGAYAQHGDGDRAFQVFQTMDLEGEKSDPITLISVLSVCSDKSSALSQGKAIHSSISGSGLELDGLVATALIDMYATCGSLRTARDFFDAIQAKGDVVLWSAIISGYSQHGDWEESTTLFRLMQLEGLEPDNRTITSVLSAFSHGGLVDQATEWFGTMVEACDMKPAIDHYMCLIDLLGRAGCLEAAELVMKRMPCKADTVAWTTLLGSCTTHGDVHRGARAAGQMRDDSGAYVSLRNICIEQSQARRS
ncbi:pentatricopeptide repeat-containing protein At4g32430, mitochondrial isoform X1 [Selaginella moellendorffii]|uniref:pentatricopeptide repeat-containing protein At4g32430, mitochondrial isoform X1 n=1 Tax=Selaginella moellendorffii TaxID=88036 RepID=UPI000D1C5C5B|nr:pentatricopeptide repeat-containing protein At4g32430, mitochondrial isoform X1 [Selaginella moellendorffii]|eukprot:XP_024531700.1 pentatricopeptide repeat-containing protein At4g32430, mitochondrial isoform X1 [Selaginella moellendorffii]